VSFKSLLDLEVGSSFTPGCGSPCFHLGLPRASSVQLALQQSQPIDLSLRGVEKGGRPLEARLQVLVRVRIDKQRDRQQIALLLILITDDLPSFGLLGGQSRLSSQN